MKLLHRKGLFLEVKSWENDADHQETNRVEVDSIEQARAYKRMFLELFKSENNGENGIGNSFDDCYERIEEYRLSDEYFSSRYTEEEFQDFINDRTPDFVGYSVEGYNYRICEDCKIIEVKEDVYINEKELE